MDLQIKMFHKDYIMFISKFTIKIKQKTLKHGGELRKAGVLMKNNNKDRGHQVHSVGGISSHAELDIMNGDELHTVLDIMNL